MILDQPLFGHFDEVENLEQKDLSFKTNFDFHSFKDLHCPL